MSSVIAADLSNTVVARWLQRLADRETPRRSHLRTKIMYWRALAALVALSTDRPLSWRDIVAAAQPRGARSTFYEVAGAHARHRMIDDLIADGRSDSFQLALRYQRSDAVAQLLDEAKIWSYWPYRKQTLDRLAAEGQCDIAAQTVVIETGLVVGSRQPTVGRRARSCSTCVCRGGSDRAGAGSAGGLPRRRHADCTVAPPRHGRVTPLCPTVSSSVRTCGNRRTSTSPEEQ